MDTSPAAVLDLRSVFGLTATVTTPAAATDGAYVEMDVTAEPGSGTTIHFHPDQAESYQVREGTLDVFHEGQRQAVPAGDLLVVPANAVHAFRNASDAPVRFRNVHRPALAFRQHLETLDRLCRAGKIRGTSDPRSLIYMSMSAVEHRPAVSVKPPQWAVRGLAFIGRRLGLTLPGPASHDRGA